LDITHFIPGLIAVVIINKNISTLFEPIENGEIENSIPKYHHRWKKTVFEKLLRIINFTSLFLSGLSRPYQNVIWISDEDEILPNDERLRDATNLFGLISSSYLNHTLGHFRWGTTKIDSRERMLEDLVSIADLVAGSLATVLSMHKEQKTFPIGDLIVPPPQNMTRKNKDIMDWFSDNTRILKRVVFVIEPSEDKEGFNLKQLRFHGTRDFLPLNYPFMQ